MRRDARDDIDERRREPGGTVTATVATPPVREAARTSLPRVLSADAATLRRVIEENADAILMVDGEGNVRLANRAAEEMFGRPASELVNEAFGLPVVEGESSELEIIRPDGRSCVVEMRIVRSSWGQELTYIVSLRDISVRRQLEEQLRQAQKMEALGRLAGGISHDFNNMLTSILCESSLLVEGLATDDPRRRAAEQIRKTAARAAELTGQLLTFSRRRVVRREHVDVTEAARDMERMLRRLIGEEIELKVDTGERPLPVSLGRAAVEQIILNLVLNARDAMPDGGTLEIKTSYERFKQPARGAVNGPDGGEYAALTVRDTGTGMTPQVQARLFEPFFTTKEDGKGTGLGLSVVYGIVEQAGGRIVISSEPDQGSVFRVFLPLDVDAASPTATAGAEASVPTRAVAPGGPKTVLIVEDEEAVREILCEVIEQEGHRVLSAADGFAALALLADRQTSIDLLITDVSMPRLTGPELVRRMHQERPDMPVLFLSGYPKAEALDRHLDWNRVGFLGKPFTHTELLAAVRKQLAAAAAARYQDQSRAATG